MRINGGTVSCAVVADICRVPVSFYMAAAGGKHGQQTDQDGFFQHFRSPLAADFASHNFNTPLNGVFKVFFRQTAGQITDIIVGDRQTAVFVGPGRCFRGKSVHCLDQLPGFGNADAAAVGKKQFFDFSAAVMVFNQKTLSFVTVDDNLQIVVFLGKRQVVKGDAFAERNFVIPLFVETVSNPPPSL